MNRVARHFPFFFMGCALMACSGGGGDASPGASTGAGAGTGAASSDPTGIWSATLASDDPEQPASAGWLVIAADGSFHLDTDAAVFNGTTRTQGASFTANTTGRSFGVDSAGGGSFTFSGKITSADAMTGTWSGANRRGTFDFHYDAALSRQAASLPAIASTYEGELWIRDTMQRATITIGADGALNASTTAGCALSGTLGVADAARNSYQWNAMVSGCSANGTAGGTGFLIGNYSIYLTGSLPDGPVWMGGVDGDASNP